jgi:hypothetical protein
MATLSLTQPIKSRLHEVFGFVPQSRLERKPVSRPVVNVPQPEPVRVPGVSREIVVKIASEADEWEQAFQLVAANYQERGYEAADKAYRFTPYHTLPDTTVFVAKCEGRVVATFSLVADNTLLGLPMEAIYGEEIAALRRQGKRLAEVTSLAAADLGQREFLQVFMALIRLMKQYHVSRGGDTWVITVNPRHRNFYCKVLGYRTLGPCKAYAAVGDAPAEAYVLDRDTMRAEAPRAHEQIFGEWLPPAALTGVPVSRPFIRYFWAESNPAGAARLESLLSNVAAFGSPRAW